MDRNQRIIRTSVVGVAVAAKLLMGHCVKKVGEEVGSGSLIASGSDAFFDAVLSLATLVAAAASLLWSWKLEGALGVVISLIIIKAGVEMLLDPINSIIGLRADAELSEQIKAAVRDKLAAELAARRPGYRFDIVLDSDYTD